MITVCSGVPGSGKTAFVVDQILNSSEYKDRRVLTNIDSLIRENTEILTNEELLNWYDICQPNDVIVIDEFQYVWPKRQTNSKVPDSVSKLDIHRHFGVDFFLITQGFGKIDGQIKTGEVVGQHYHFWDSRILTWIGYSQRTVFSNLEPNPIQAIKRGKTSLYKPPERVFGFYKSAEAHTKPKVEKSRLLWVLLFALAFAGYFVYQSMQSHSERFDPASEKAKSFNSGGVEHSTATELKNSDSFNVDALTQTNSSYPESMPIFDGHRPLKPLRQIKGCLKSQRRKTCECFDADGIQILDTDLQTCENWLDGKYYTPFHSSGGKGAGDKDIESNSVSVSPVPPPPAVAKQAINVTK